jgi:DNA-binding response OmpR family regulator
LTEFNKETGFTGLSPLRILLVDHDTDSIETLNILLTLDGHLVETAVGQQGALQLAGTFRPNVVLFNPAVSNIDCGNVIEGLRGALTNLLLIAIIDWQEVNENPLHWKEMGFDHHLSKPLRIEDVIALLKRST